MKTKDEVKIYIDPFHAEIKNKENGFELIFFGHTNNGKGKKHIIVFNFRTWWIKYLVRDFIKLIAEKHKGLDNISSELKINNEEK